MINQETVYDWLNRTHKERYEKNKSYQIIDSAGYILISECSSTYPPHWYFTDVLNRIVVNVEETETQFIVTARKLGRE